MNTNILKKALIPGIPAAIGAWFIYGVIASFFDDNVFEQMGKPMGIVIALAAIAGSLAFFYRRIVKQGAQEGQEAQNIA